MTTVFRARPYGRFIKAKNNFGRRKLHRTRQLKIHIKIAKITMLDA